MFYDQTAIDFLTLRLEWAAVIPPTTIPFVPENSTSNSGRYFKDFNALVTVENIYASIQNASVEDNFFSTYMNDLKATNVLSVLSIVFDNEERANYRYCYTGRRIDISGIDYSATIQSKTRLFDNLLGLKMAITCLELFLTSSRENGTNRSINFDVAMLKQELEGVFSVDMTKIITKGLNTKFSIEIEKVKNILFPVERKNTVRGVSVW